MFNLFINDVVYTIVSSFKALNSGKATRVYYVSLKCEIRAIRSIYEHILNKDPP